MRAFFLLALLCFFGCRKDRPKVAPLPDRPLGTAVHFHATHLADGKDNPHQFKLSGILGSKGELTLDNNTIRRDPKSGVVTTTALGYLPGKVRIRRSDGTDPHSLGRTVYNVVSDKPMARSYLLALAPTSYGPHHVFISEGGNTLGEYLLTDRYREQHEGWANDLAAMPADDRQAITRLQAAVGYAFMYLTPYTDPKHVTSLFMWGSENLGAIEAAVAEFKALSGLILYHGRLRAGDMNGIAGKSSLRRVEFQDFDIDDAGLACLEGMKTLTMVSLRDSRGMTDDGLKHIAGLTNLESLDLGGTSVTDAGLKHLEGLQNLRSLDSTQTRVTAEGRAALKAKLPKLEEVSARTRPVD